MNIIQINGFLGKDPVQRVTPKGQKVLNMNLAVNSSRKGEDGKNITCWYRVTAWGDHWDRMIPYLKKGSGIIVIGELLPPTIYEKDGNKSINLEVNAEMMRFMLSAKKEESTNQAPQYTGGETSKGKGPSVFETQEEIPF